MATDTQKLFSTIDRGLKAAIGMIGIDVLNSSVRDIEQRLYGSPRIQEIISSGEFTQSSIEFLESPLVVQYLASIRGGELIRDKSPMLNIFREVLDRIDRIRSIDNAIQEVFKELREILYSKKFQLRAFTILQNFRAEKDFTLNAGQDVGIKRCTYEETLPIHRLIEQGSSMWEGYNHSTVFYIAELLIDHLLEEQFRIATDKAFQLLHWGLKLCNSNRVSISSTYYVGQPFNWHPFHLAVATRVSNIEPVFWDGKDEYFLNNELVEEVSSVIKTLDHKLNKLPEESANRLKMAMERYMKADSTRAIVDIVTAFETILLPGVEAELGFRLAQRTAVLIGNGYKDRVDIFNNMKRIYGARSRLVHGESSGKISNELDALNTISRDYLRRCMLVLLDIIDPDMGKYLDHLPLAD
jgi:hypothetical protein